MRCAVFLMKVRAMAILKIKLWLLSIMFRKEKDTMAEVYATLIVKGLKKFSDVPAAVKPKVEEVLIALDLGELVNA